MNHALLAYWQESLLFFTTPSTFLFLLLGFKNIKDSLKVIPHSGYLVASGFCAALLFLESLSASLALHPYISTLVQCIILPLPTLFLFFTFFMAIWPSLQIKNESYFASFKQLNIILGIIYFIIMYTNAHPLLPFVLITHCFLYDQHIALKDDLNNLFVQSVSRTSNFYYYNAPLLIGLQIICTIIVKIIYFFLSLFFIYANIWTFLVTIPYLVCLATNIYLKRTHEQCELYFKQ